MKQPLERIVRGTVAGAMLSSAVACMPDERLRGIYQLDDSTSVPMVVEVYRARGLGKITKIIGGKPNSVGNLDSNTETADVYFTILGGEAADSLYARLTRETVSATQGVPPQPYNPNR